MCSYQFKACILFMDLFVCTACEINVSKFSACEAQMRMPIVVISRLWDAHTCTDSGTRTPRKGPCCVNSNPL